MGDWQGWGIRFNNASVGDIVHAVGRAVGLFYNDQNSINQNA